MKKSILLIPVIFLIVLIPFVQASALTNSLMGKIEFWWQGFNGASQVPELIRNNTGNMTQAGAWTVPVGKTYAAYSSHNDSTEYYGANGDTISSYSKVGIGGFQNDFSGGFCFSVNFSQTIGKYRALLSMSDSTCATAACRIALWQNGDSNNFIFDYRWNGNNITAFTFGAVTDGQKTFVCVGNTGERFWAFQGYANKSCSNKTLSFTDGADKKEWYGDNLIRNGSIGMVADFSNNRYIQDESQSDIDFGFYFNATPITEELIELCNGTTLGSDPLNYSNVFITAVVDTTPPAITLINITSEGGLGQIIDLNNKLSGRNRTNDTTPQFFVITNEAATCAVIDNDRNLNWTNIFAGNTNGDTGAPATTHTLTLNDTNATSIGLRNFSIGCKDSTGNENSTSTSGKFTINITDPNLPNATIFKPNNNSVYKVPTNFSLDSTIIQFNWTCNDLYDTILANCSLFVNGNLRHNVTNIRNNTLVSSNLTFSSAGSYEWYVNATDSFGNRNQSQTFYFTINTININFTLNEYKNNTLLYSGTNVIFNFTVNFSDTIDKCFLYINNKINASNVTLITTNRKYNLTSNLSIGDYNWSIGCNTSSNEQKNSTDIFNLFVNNMPNVTFVIPTLANNSITSNLSVLINVSTAGKIDKYILEWNGTNESFTSFNSTLNILVNKSGLADFTTYTYKVYVNDTNGNKNQTELRLVKTNTLGIIVSISTNVNFTFKSFVVETESVMPNETIGWAGNNTARQLIKNRIRNESVTVYNNGTKINQGGNYTVYSNGQITFINSTTYFNGSNNELITNKINVSYTFFSGNFTLRVLNISCSGQNESIGCINVSSIFGNTLNLSLIFNITLDPVNQKIIEDFSTNALNWTVFQLRSNNTINKTIVNSSIACGEIQSINSVGLIEYRFNNSLTMIYLNSSNQSNLINLSFNCTSVNSFKRILNGSQTNISGFNFFNFSWKGDNTTNTFQINLIDGAGTKVSSSTLTLANPDSFNYSGISLGTLKNITIINISVTNTTGTKGLNGFYIDNLKLTNSTSNQSNRVKMRANCNPNYPNSTNLTPNVLTSICPIPLGTTTKYIWLYQDINLTQKGINWRLQYNVTIIS